MGPERLLPDFDLNCGYGDRVLGLGRVSHTSSPRCGTSPSLPRRAPYLPTPRGSSLPRVDAAGGAMPEAHARIPPPSTQPHRCPPGLGGQEAGGKNDQCFPECIGPYGWASCSLGARMWVVWFYGKGALKSVLNPLPPPITEGGQTVPSFWGRVVGSVDANEKDVGPPRTFSPRPREGSPCVRPQEPRETVLRARAHPTPVGGSARTWVHGGSGLHLRWSTEQGYGTDWPN